jgi:nucleoside-diphosphate-sugar epimerase
MAKRILITGATGYLGRHCAAAFVANGDELFALVRPSSHTEALKRLGVRLHIGTLDQPDQLTEALRTVDVVVHLVAKVHTHGFWRDFCETTVTGTRNILAAATAASISHFVHVSTVGVYGWPRSDRRPYLETDPVGRPYRWNYYTRAKILAEQFVLQSPVPWTILRPTWIYGPKDTAGLGRIVAALRKRQLRVIGDGSNRLSLIHVDDVATAVVAAVHNPRSRSEIFNVAADELCCSQRELIAALCQQAGLPEPTGHVSFRTACRLAFFCECLAHATGYIVYPALTRLTVLLLGGERQYNAEKIRSALGWRPSVALLDGVESALHP